MSFHAARLGTSKRLQRLVAFLRERGERGATTWEIMQACKLLNVSTYVSEVRHNGLDVTCDH